MKIKKIFGGNSCAFIFSLLTLFSLRVGAQCASCSTVITSNSTVALTVNAGSTLCINSGITYSGNITLNGGVLCNQGAVLKITFNSGTFNNYGTFNQSTAVNMNNTGNVVITNYPFAIFTTGGAFNHSPNNAANGLTLNIYSGARFITGGAFTSNKGSVTAFIGLPDPNGTPGSGGTTGGAPAFFNIDGQFNISNTTLNIYNLNGSFVNITGALSLDAKNSKNISNFGSFNLSNSFNVGGNGQNTGTVVISNYKDFNITDHLNLSYNNGVVQVVNNGIFNVGKSITISKDGNSVTNNNVMNLGNDLNIEHGLAVNNATVTVRDIDAKFGILQNENILLVNRDLITSNSQATVNNNGFIGIARNLDNKALINLGNTSVIQTVNYSNAGANANISSTLNVADTSLYPKIVISGNSVNSAIIGGRIIVYDLSLVSQVNNIGYGFDQVTNGGNISNNVIFMAKAVGPGNGNSPVLLPCPIKINYLYSAKIQVAPKGPICPGQPVFLTALLYYSITNGTNTITYYLSPVLLTYTWIPPANYGNPNQQNQVVTPLVATTYDVQIGYLGCIWIAGVSVNVQSPANYFVTIAGAPDIIFPYPDGANVVATVTGGTPPFNYSWAPAQFCTPPNVNNPNINPPFGLNFTVTVSDAIGCLTTATVNIIPAPYAPLNKKPDGGYYKLVNNKMLFKVDGQYATTNLVYNVYNKANSVVSSNLGNNLVNIPTVNSGDNRYSLNATTLPTGYYTLEVINEKNEKMYLRFIR